MMTNLRSPKPRVPSKRPRTMITLAMSLAESLEILMTVLVNPEIPIVTTVTEMTLEAMEAAIQAVILTTPLAFPRIS